MNNSVQEIDYSNMDFKISFKENEPSPYHLFTVQNKFFVYDTKKCTFFKIDSVAYRFLQLLSKHSMVNVRNLMLQEGYTETEISSILEDISILMLHGFADKPTNDFTFSTCSSLTETVYSFEMLLADDCNLACKYCYMDNYFDKRLKKRMTQETASRIIDLLFALAAKRNAVDIVFFGGEPLLNKKTFFHILEYATRQGDNLGKKVTFRMTTNATLIDDKVVEAIIKYKIAIMVSLDGPKTLHDSQCPTQGGMGSFELAIKGIKKLLSRGIHTEVRCTMTHPTPDIKKLLDFFYEFKFCNIVLGPTTNLLDAPGNCDFDIEDYKAYNAQVDELLPWIYETKFKEGTLPAFFPYKDILRTLRNGSFECKIPSEHCGAGGRVLCASADGEFYPCSRFSGMKAWAVGNIERGIDEEKLKKFWSNYRAIIKSTCSSCWAWAICTGPCPWELATPDGNFHTTLRKCSYYTRRIEQGAFVYSEYFSHFSS